VLAGHVVFAVLYSALFANIAWLMPLLVRLRFGADDTYWKNWQTTLVTASVPVLLICSIFWGELLRHVSLRRYLLIFWSLGAVPLACVALVQNYWQLLACHLVTSFGTAGWAPVNGYLLKNFYPRCTARSRLWRRQPCGPGRHGGSGLRRRFVDGDSP